MHLSQRNGLYVVEQGSDFGAIDAALAEIDHRLYLSWEVDARYGDPRDGARVYRVLYDRGDQPPATVAEWRNEYGAPLPLSSGLVELVKSLRPRDGVDLERAQRANEEKAARETADFERDVDEIAADMGPRISDKRSAVLHRGQHLRLARARRARQ